MLRPDGDCAHIYGVEDGYEIDGPHLEFYILGHLRQASVTPEMALSDDNESAYLAGNRRLAGNGSGDYDGGYDGQNGSWNDSWGPPPGYGRGRRENGSWNDSWGPPPGYGQNGSRPFVPPMCERQCQTVCGFLINDTDGMYLGSPGGSGSGSGEGSWSRSPNTTVDWGPNATSWTNTTYDGNMTHDDRTTNTFMRRLGPNETTGDNMTYAEPGWTNTSDNRRPGPGNGSNWTSWYGSPNMTGVDCNSPEAEECLRRCVQCVDCGLAGNRRLAGNGSGDYDGGDDVSWNDSWGPPPGYGRGRRENGSWNDSWGPPPGYGQNGSVSGTAEPCFDADGGECESCSVCWQFAGCIGGTTAPTMAPTRAPTTQTWSTTQRGSTTRGPGPHGHAGFDTCYRGPG